MNAKEIRSLTIEEIENKLVEVKDKLFKQKVQKSLGQVENPYKIRQSRKEIARLLTILAEKKRSPNGKEEGPKRDEKRDKKRTKKTS